MFENTDSGVRFGSGSMSVSTGQGADLMELAVQLPFMVAGGELKSGAIFSKPLAGFKGMGGVAKGFFVAAPLDVAISGATAAKGHMASSMIGATTATAASALAWIAGTTVAGPLGGAVAAFATDSLIRGPVTRMAQNFAGLDDRTRSLRMGGNYRDTQMAYTMRQVAARELGGSLLNARHHLGKEAALMAD